MTTTDDRRLFDDAGQPIRRPGHDQPVHVSPLSGPRPVAPEHSVAPQDAPAPCADPLSSRRQSDWPVPPDYGRPPTATGALLLAIDQQIAGSIAARNQELRRALVDAQARAIRERTRRQDALVRLATVQAQRDALQAERDRLAAHVAELKRTVDALGALVVHAAGHDKTAPAASDAEGGE